MKAILVGHPGSQHLVPASKYLAAKYTPFELFYLNYEGPIDEWSSFVAEYLDTLDDRMVVFALDDYLISGPLDLRRFRLLQWNLRRNVICARLCDSSFYNDKMIHGEVVRVGPYEDYTCTTQYCIWRTRDLIHLLSQTGSPWDFEMRGSGLLNASGKRVVGTVEPALPYDEHSALSKRWEGVQTNGLDSADIEYLTEHGYL